MLVRTLSYNIQRQWVVSEDKNHRRQWPVFLSTIIILTLIIIDGDNVYVTDTDQVFFWGTVMYTIFYLLFHLSEWAYTYSQEQPVFNIIAGALQLISTRIYCGAQTPYNDVMLCMIGTRGWYVYSFFWLWRYYYDCSVAGRN